MTWQNVMTCLLRTLIGDDGEEKEYVTSRLEQIIVNSAHFVVTELDFTTTYTIDVSGCDISPDPTSVDDSLWFINLVVLKAACVIAASEYKVKAGNAISVKDGPSSIDARGSAAEFKERYHKFCEDYESAKLQYMSGESIVGTAVMTPYTNESVIPFLLNLS